MAVRTLELTMPDGDAPVAFSISVPEQDGTAWLCRYEIGWPQGRRSGASYGLDAVQALWLTLQKIGVDL